LFKVSSDHLNKQQIVQEQKHNDETDAENQEEEEAGPQEENHPLISSPNPMPGQPTTTSTTDTPVKSKKEEEDDAEKKRIQRRKASRFRWHLLYTLHNNGHLFDLRKGFQSRIARLYEQRIAMLQEQQFIAVSTTTEVPESDERAVGFAEPPADESLVDFCNLYILLDGKSFLKRELVILNDFDLTCIEKIFFF
jgi:hypothetical protein